MERSIEKMRKELSKAKDKDFFKPPDIAKCYNFPKGLTGQGQKIGVIALGGGYEKDHLDRYFKDVIGINTPTITDVELYETENEPYFDFTTDIRKALATAEMYIDLEIIGSIAKEAEIVVYFAPPEAAGLLAALQEAVKNENEIDVISISWACQEASWLLENNYLRDDFNIVFNEAEEKNITICAAAGDKGTIKRHTEGFQVWFPSSHPKVLGCGGTKLTAKNGKIDSEIVWNEKFNGPGPFKDFLYTSGGGFSAHYSRPGFQDILEKHEVYKFGSRKDKRGTPDVCAHASSNNGYLVHLGEFPFYWAGGTSCSAPLWAALIALINEGLGHNVGFVNDHLYKIADTTAYSSAFNDITKGTNELSNIIGHKAGRHWDPCTGLGSPNGQGLLDELT